MSNTLILILSVLVLSLGGLGKLYYSEVKSHGVTSAKLAERITEINKVNAKMLEYTKRVEDLRLKSAKYDQEVAKLRNDNQAYSRELEALRGREEVVIAKPELVEKIVNKAYMRNQYELACITGDATACKKLEKQ